jgi:photosystem II stability/assembly factor-like uncharacterized protein
MKRFLFTIITIVIASMASNSVSNAQVKSTQPYVWKNIQIVGGGFVDGIVFHPKVKDVRYARTDMGGAYRWNATTNIWESILDWIPYADLNLVGVESIALDPKNPDKVYLACGTYTNPETPDGAILISNDRAKTFTRVNVPIKFGGNENGRGNGERMMVDPNFCNIIYLGTRNAGLWKSTDAGLSWAKVDSFPDVSEKLSDEEKKKWWLRGCGINLVVFDPNEKSKEASTVYVCASVMNQDNFFCSKDGGKTWKTVSGQPPYYRPTHAIVASNRIMYITYGTSPGPSPMKNGAVWKYELKSGKWTEISPIKHNPKATNAFGYAAVSVDASNPNVLIVSTFSKGKDGDEIFRSVDGGKSWKTTFLKDNEWDRSNAPFTIHTPIHWMLDVEIDPFNSNHAMFVTGYGGWETFNLSNADKDKPLKWNIMSKGIEETVSMEICSPTKGAQVLNAVLDYCGFLNDDLDNPNPDGCFGAPHFMSTSSITCAENNPNIVVRCGRSSLHKPGKNFGYSLDGGKTWFEPATVPTDKTESGFVAVSSDGEAWVWAPGEGWAWAPQKSADYQTTDKGATWTKVNGLPDNTRVIADRVNPKKFYAMNLFAGKLYTSTDGGLNFSEHVFVIPGGIPKKEGNRGDWRGGQDKIYTTPGKEGDLWIAAYNGLYHSENSGESFYGMPSVVQVDAFGFGKAAEGNTFPSLYLVGTVDSLHGIFRSDDGAKTWVRINDDAHQWGLILQISGDPKRYGRVYVGTHGRGIQYGDIK